MIRMGKRVIILLIIGIILSPCLSFADEIKIPFAMDKKVFYKELRKEGMEFEHEGPKVFGFLEHHGTSMSVFTYQHVTQEDLEKIQRATWKSLRKNG